MKKQAKKQNNAPMLSIGATKESVKAAQDAVMDILLTPSGTTEKIAALETLGRICSVNGASIQNCTFTNK